jgi:predicted RNA-binding Zn-ribbon protein involved in translation (DUF1610 family)
MYIITRGFQEGKQLTAAQKSSPLFAEEPVVLGRVLRRGSKPMRLAEADYKANEQQLLRLEKAGAIKIERPKEEAMAAPKPCSLCGQVPRGQGGEYKCPVCGLPTVMDLSNSNQQGAGDAPTSQEGAGAPTPEAAAPPAPPEVIIPPPPEPPAPPPQAEDPPAPPPPAPEPAPVVEKKEEVSAPPPSAPKAESKPSSKKKGASK